MIKILKRWGAGIRICMSPLKVQRAANQLLIFFFLFSFEIELVNLF